ncbi:short-chain dehydrogenase reductase 3b-like [Telopea speciosissima]|uniref:short-chain dehydrogenase reductase 3b-like n=1 Tax=Telopea speciosissima TaxID=54955 RepID=UPI001CC7E05D|nr:short-chain dehydrogenase reductase 3b-like [Telopea speciosissima]
MADEAIPPQYKSLEGKVAIVTGGASGIGETTACLFADHGSRAVVIADIQDEKGELLVTSIGTHRCSYIHCDVADEDQVKSMVDWTIQKYGRLDIMFSNAGILNTHQTILDLDLSAMDRLFSINVKGMAACVKHAGRAMVEGGIKGSIVCTASAAASVGTGRHTDYTMSKHAVLGLVRSASRQLGRHGIRVNCVSPSGLATPMLCQSYGMDEDGVEKVFSNSTSLEGLALKVNHVAEAVLFLASDASAFVTGHNLAVDGGYVPRQPRSDPTHSFFRPVAI